MYFCFTAVMFRDLWRAIGILAAVVSPARGSSQGLYATAAGSGQLGLVNTTTGATVAVGPPLSAQVRLLPRVMRTTFSFI